MACQSIIGYVLMITGYPHPPLEFLQASLTGGRYPFILMSRGGGGLQELRVLPNMYLFCVNVKIYLYNIFTSTKMALLHSAISCFGAFMYSKLFVISF